MIEWENPAANDFLLVSQFSVTGALYTCRPDLVGFVNGLPLVVIELKKPGEWRTLVPDADATVITTQAAGGFVGALVGLHARLDPP